MAAMLAMSRPCMSLNESPSEKEGKSPSSTTIMMAHWAAMKVPPKRKGNAGLKLQHLGGPVDASMKVPPKRKGNAAPGPSPKDPQPRPQ